MSAAPKYSVLIPSRNRVELLRCAVQSVLLQTSSSPFEIVISDNASEEDYESLVDGLGDGRVRLSRSEAPLSVTANWNRALADARGDYVVMLGDDDALTPGYFTHVDALLAHYGEPDAIYAPIYHYAYPGVVPARPDGYLISVDNSVLFRADRTRYWLAPDEARRLGARCLAFHHDVGFNAQHFLYRLDWMKGLAGEGTFYRTNYPDYFACFSTFLSAARILVDTRPLVIVGISKRSYGYFHINGRAAEGAAQFMAARTEDLDEAAQSPDAIQALALPGNAHTRSWLVAALAAETAVAGPIARTDLRRYRRIQAVETATAVAEGKAPLRAMTALRSAFPTRERQLADMVFFHLRGDALRGGDVYGAAERLRAALNVYLAPRTQEIALGRHSTILDAFAACAAADAQASTVAGLIGDLEDAVGRLSARDYVDAELAAARHDLTDLRQTVRTIEAALEAERAARVALAQALAASEADHERRRTELAEETVRADAAAARADILAGELEAALQTISAQEEKLWLGSWLLGAARALRRGGARR